MPAKPPIKKIDNQQKDAAEIEFKKAETKEKEALVIRGEEEIIIKKLEILETLLSSTLLEESCGVTTFTPAVSGEWDRKVISNKIIELVKKL